MRYEQNHSKLGRGASPDQELRHGFSTWVSGLRSIDLQPADLSNHPATSLVPVTEEHDKDHSRWQDDGGEGG